MLKVSHIRKSYGKRNVVLSDVSFTCAPGEQIALVGRNGCGKSSLLRILAGVDRADGGTISFYGQKATDSRIFQTYTGYLPQDNPLLLDVPVKDNLSLWGGRRGAQDPWFLSTFDLTDLLREKTGHLSGGMQRRLAIACACAAKPPILILDEPTAALDLDYKKSIRDFMASYRKGGAMLVIATHDEREMEESTRVLHLENGVLREEA